MKKTLFLLLLTLFSTATFAQYSIGAKIGYNTSLGFEQDWSYDNSSVSMKNDISNGFHVGLYARIGYALYLQPEVLYNYSMYNMEFDNDDRLHTAVSKQVKTNTIDVPVLIGYHLINGNFFKFRIMAGPKMSFNVGSTQIESYNDVLALSRGYRIGLDAGIGIDLWRISLDLRYNLMPNMYEYIDMATEAKINNSPTNSFAISIGFKIQGSNIRNRN